MYMQAYRESMSSNFLGFSGRAGKFSCYRRKAGLTAGLWFSAVAEKDSGLAEKRCKWVFFLSFPLSACSILSNFALIQYEALENMNKDNVA